MNKSLFMVIGILFLAVSILSAGEISPLMQDKGEEKAYFLKCRYIPLNKTLKNSLDMLIKNETFRETSEIAEMNFRKNKSLYSYEYLKIFDTLLKGTDGKSGYLKYIEDIYNDNYIFYSPECKNNKVLIFVLKDINKNLALLHKAYILERNVRPFLKNIFRDIIFLLKQEETETKIAKEYKIIKPFNKKMDEKYKMPEKWAQPDGKTTFEEISHFILYGDRSFGIVGIKFYYNNVYSVDKPLYITH